MGRVVWLLLLAGCASPVAPECDTGTWQIDFHQPGYNVLGDTVQTVGGRYELCD